MAEDLLCVRDRASMGYGARGSGVVLRPDWIQDESSCSKKWILTGVEGECGWRRSAGGGGTGRSRRGLGEATYTEGESCVGTRTDTRQERGRTGYEAATPPGPRARLR
jgi:hypothetical protein